MSKASPKIGGPRVRPLNPVRRVSSTSSPSVAADTSAKAEYKVGHGHPPKATQFKPGISGNPKGRPRGAKGHMASLKKELNSKVTVTKNGREEKITKSDAYFASLVNNMIKTPGKHQLEFLKLLYWLDEQDAEKSDQQSLNAPGEDEESKAIIRRFKCRIARQLKKAESDDTGE